jgi:hypothetical protein
MWSLSGTTRLWKGARTLGYILHETWSIISWRTLIFYGTPTVRHFLTFPTTRMPYKLQENRYDHDSQGTFCLRPDPNGHSFSRSGGQTLGQFSEPERVQSEADGIGVEVRRWTTLFSGNLIHAKATHALHTARRLIQISQNFPHWFVVFSSRSVIRIKLWIHQGLQGGT